MHPFPDIPYRVEVYYRQSGNIELSGTARPLIPDEYAQVLVYGALARGYPIFLNDTERGSYFQQLFNDIIGLMVAQARRHEGHPQIAPRDSYRGFYRRGRGATPGRVDLGSTFDRWPSNP